MLGTVLFISRAIEMCQNFFHSSTIKQNQSIHRFESVVLVASLRKGDVGVGSCMDVRVYSPVEMLVALRVAQLTTVMFCRRCVAVLFNE